MTLCKTVKKLCNLRLIYVMCKINFHMSQYCIYSTESVPTTEWSTKLKINSCKKYFQTNIADDPVEIRIEIREDKIHGQNSENLLMSDGVGFTIFHRKQTFICLTCLFKLPFHTSLI